MRKGLMLALAAVLALSLVTSACTTVSTEPIKIVVVTSMTGATAVTGKQVDAGVRHAADEWNARGGIKGRKIEVITEDDTSTPAGALNAFNKGMAQKPVAVWAPTFTPYVMTMAPEIKKAKVPVFTSATAPVVTAAATADGYIFRLRTNDNEAAAIAAKYALETLKARKPAIIYPSNDYGKGGYNIARGVLEKAGVKLVAEEQFNQGDKDVSAQLTKIKAAAPDVLISWTIPVDSGLIAVQAKQVGLQATILGGPGFGTPEFLGLAKEAAEGIHVLLDANVGLGASDAATQQFEKKFKEKFKDVPVSFVVSTNFDGAQVLFQAIEKVGTDPAKLKQAILATKGYKGVSGEYSFDAEGNGLHQAVIGKWGKGNKFEPVTTIKS